MSCTVKVVESGDSFLCKEDENVLEGMYRLGKRGIPLGCRGGGCGVCKVAVLQGDYRTRKMSSCHISEADLDQGVVLACRIFPTSDLELSVIGAMKKNVLK